MERVESVTVNAEGESTATAKSTNWKEEWRVEDMSNHMEIDKPKKTKNKRKVTE